MYSKQLKVGLLLLYFSVAQTLVCDCMHILLHPVNVFLDLARAATTAPGFLPRVYKGHQVNFSLTLICAI